MVRLPWHAYFGFCAFAVGLAVGIVSLAVPSLWPQLPPLAAHLLLGVAGLLFLIGMAAFVLGGWSWIRGLLDERDRLQDAVLRDYLHHMEQWVLDKDKPLAKAQRDDPRRAVARRRTLDVLEQLGPNGKRKVLAFLYESRLLDRTSFVINLNNADFSGANLAHLHLREAWIGFANFRNADLTGATFSDFDTEVFRRKANNMGLSTEDIGYHVYDCMLWHNDFSGANLKDARLGGCNLAGVDFEGANLDGTDLRGAFFLGAINLTQKQLNKAYGAHGQWRDETRALPEGLEIPKAWYTPIREQREAR